jgi:hypothetical protein
MFYVRVKYQEQEIPIEYAFETKEKAKEWADWKEKFKPYVENAKVDNQRRYPNNDLGKIL